MRLVNFQPAGQEAGPRAGLLRGRVVIDISSEAAKRAAGAEAAGFLPGLVDEYVMGSAAVRAAVAHVDESIAAGADDPAGDGVHSVDGIRFLPPILRPGKVIAAGRNFHGHFKESQAGWAERGVEVHVPDAPMGFVKVSSSLVGHREPVAVPDWITQVDYEVELVAVIGRRADNVSPQDALDYVVGYTVANDVSAREIQLAEMGAGGSPIAGKNPRTFGPMGPALVTADEVEDPQALRLWATVNGDLRQDASTSDMVFTVAQLVSWYSQMGLDPGDMIMSGTPAGVGLYAGKGMLQCGDVVTCGVDGIGELESTIAVA